MATSQESLYSLELVVEKIYLPYVTCRFPAVAFRLLDFPTILINHVEKDLAANIKKKINADPYYRVPNQFAELQDKHGNFMVKKGKSCLFKLTLDTLAMHLANTPMYIMVIDEFPEVPKLLGNSSLALNEVVDLIKADVKQNGHTVPSVHGDKGLFKIYSLMGKEIGYMVMGFRLLSLGPGMIAHLPSSALAKRASERKKQGQVVQQSVIDEIMEVRDEQMVQAVSKPVHSSSAYRGPSKSKEQANTREMGSMTQVDKCDALMQTLDLEDEKIHVEVSAKEEKKVSKTIETQTEKMRRVPQKPVVKFEMKSDDTDSDDGIMINPNINCPPPLFYNSKAEPEVYIERDVNAYLGYSAVFDDETLEDLSGDEHVEQKKSSELSSKGKNKDLDIPMSGIVPEQPRLNDAKTVVISNIKGADKQSNQGMIPGLNLQALTSEPAFPLLTALLTELSKIQNPQFVTEAMKQVSEVKSRTAQEKKTVTEPATVLKSRSEENVFDITQLNENASRVSVKKSGKKKTTAQTSENGPKHKGWIRKAPEAGVKKTKLVFGLTNTQRLRLAKQNPNWLKTAEQEEKALKANKQQQKMARTREQDFEGDTGNLSDTYTEVRRLAAVELAKATLGKSQLVNDESKTKRTKKSRSRDGSPAKRKAVQPRTKSAKTSQLKGTVKVREDTDYDSGSQGDGAEIDPESPEMGHVDKLDSAADSAPSSRLEVHIPSARAYESDENENTLDDSFEDGTETDKKASKYKFPGFNEDDTLPDSIAHDGHQSFSTTIDDDSPLESTRVSKQFRPSRHTGESLFKSTEDYDTKQFQSTDEPELQNLMSEAEKTDTLPTPPTDRSIRSQSPAMTATNTGTRLSMKFEVLNPKASQQSPLPATRRSQQLRVDSMNARPTPTETPRTRSSMSSRQPSPRPRKQLRDRRIEFKKESIHTESVSSYAPSESENILSLISDGSYSDDFHMSSEKEDSSKISVPEFPKLIPSTKLGFTIG